METLSDKIIVTSTNDLVIKTEDVKEAIGKLKEELRGIPVRTSNSGNGDKYQDIIEIWKRIDKIFGDKLT